MVKDYLDQLKCSPSDLIQEVLVQLNKSKKKFVICVNDSGIINGIVTDGDIRRAFLNNLSISDTIDKAYNTKFKFFINKRYKRKKISKISICNYFSNFFYKNIKETLTQKLHALFILLALYMKYIPT